MSEYYTKNELYGEKFYQLPKVLFTNPLYKEGLNDREKIAFALLKDRFSLSVKNEWFDDKGRIYFIFSQKALMEIFDCSNKTASNIKNALVKVGLLEIKRNGQGNADWLYLKKPVVTENDIYLIDKEENGEKIEAQTVGAVKTCKNYTSKNVENTRQEVKKIHTIETDFTDTELNQTEVNNFVNKEGLTKNDLINYLNSFYEKMSINRYNKKQWTTLINKIVSEKLEENFLQWVNDPFSYLYVCLQNACNKHDLKHNKIESEYKEAIENSPIPNFDYINN